MRVEACLHQARRIFYWPGLAKEMNDYVMFCAVCQQNQPQQRKEPMQAHLVPDVPWQVVATDLFTLEHRDYIVITDYFSNCFVVERLVRTKTYDLVDKMKKKTFSRFGIPEKVVGQRTILLPVKSLADVQENGTSNILHHHLNIHSRTERLKTRLRPARG